MESSTAKILQTAAENGYSLSKTGGLLNKSKSQVHRLYKKYGIDRTRAKRSSVDATINRNLTIEQLMWLAGLWEGEGCFTCSQASDTRRIQIQAIIAMCDEDVIKTVKNLLILPTVNISRKQPKPEWLPSYRLSISGQNSIVLMKMLYPFMHKRRRLRIEELLAMVGESV